MKKIGLLLALSALLTACGLIDKDNTPPPTPLKPFLAEIKPHRLWNISLGANAGDEFVKMGPALTPESVVASSSKGTVTAVNKVSGQVQWRTNTSFPLTTGPGTGDGLVVVGSRKGDVVAMQASTGQIVWRAALAGEILARPAIHQQIVVIKTEDGHLYGLSAKDGHSLWSYQQPEPTLILHGASAPLIQDSAIIAGFANGNLTKVGLHDGQLDWEHLIAIPEGGFAIQRMIDIDADPVLYNHHVYAATYQGKINSLDWDSGNVFWEHDISSYTGMTAGADAVYVSDAKSDLWSFDASNGSVNWLQKQLEARTISGPALMGRYVVVGDAQGYLHWLDRQDGHFAARESLGSGIFASPIVENNILYVLTNGGKLVSYTINQ